MGRDGWLRVGLSLPVCTIAAEDVDIPEELYDDDWFGAEDIPWKFMGP